MFKVPAIALIMLIALAQPCLGFLDDLFDSKEDNCFYALRHRDNSSEQLDAKLREWEITDTQKGTDHTHHDCTTEPFSGCQTYTCINADDGEHIFVLNACAPLIGNCSHVELDSICAVEGGTPKCDICHKGMCNEEKIELTGGKNDGPANATMVENETGSAKTNETGASLDDASSVSGEK